MHHYAFAKGLEERMTFNRVRVLGHGMKTWWSFWGSESSENWRTYLWKKKTWEQKWKPIPIYKWMIWMVYSGKYDYVKYGWWLGNTGWWYTYPFETYEFVNGKDDIPYRKWKIKVMFVWNHQSDEDVWQIFQSSWKPMLGTKVSLMETYGNQTRIGVSIFEQNHEDLRKKLETNMLGTSKVTRKKTMKLENPSMVHRWAQHFRQLRGPFQGPPWFSQAAQLPLSERFFMGRLQPKRCSSMETRAWRLRRLCLVYVYVIYAI